MKSAEETVVKKMGSDEDFFDQTVTGNSRERTIEIAVSQELSNYFAFILQGFLPFGSPNYEERGGITP